MQNITIQSGLFDITFNEKEVTELHEENQFLRELVLSLINPKVYNEYDNDFPAETMKTFAKEYFEKERGNNCIEYINKIFE